VAQLKNLYETGVTVSSSVGMQGREFAWTDADFDQVQAMIYKRAGISLHDGKHAMVYSRLSRRLRETGGWNPRIALSGRSLSTR
jgi:hypothetical protein